mgnify:CR=1 FL=1
MTINIGGGELKELKPRILVMGIGGACLLYTSPSPRAGLICRMPSYS